MPAHPPELARNDQGRLKPENSLPVLCISTQLVEYKFDVDFASGPVFWQGWIR